MDEQMVKEIKQYVTDKLKSKFGYVGLAEGDNLININSGEGNIKVKITW